MQPIVIYLRNVRPLNIIFTVKGKEAFCCFYYFDSYTYNILMCQCKFYLYSLLIKFYLSYSSSQFSDIIYKDEIFPLKHEVLVSHVEVNSYRIRRWSVYIQFGAAKGKAPLHKPNNNNKVAHKGTR